MNGPPRPTSQPPRTRASLVAASLLSVALFLASCGPVPPVTHDATPTQAVPTVTLPVLPPPATATPIADVEDKTEPPPPSPDLTEQALVDSLLTPEAGVYGVVILASDGSVIASRNARTPFLTASLYKLVLIADIYQRIEAGELELDQPMTLDPDYFAAGGGDMYFAWDEAGDAFPIEDLLFAAAAFSSNVAARTLLTLTDPAALRATAVEIGMDDTYVLAELDELPDWPPEAGPDSSAEDIELARQYLESSAEEGPVNITTPLDMATYQLGLVNGTVVSPWVSEQILAMLEEQLIRDRIPFLVPDGIRIVNKPGNLEDVVNDTGVLFLPEGTRTLALLSEAVPDDSRATLLLQRLALIATGAQEIPPIPETIGTPASDWVRPEN